MITAVHALLYSRNAVAARTFFRDALKLKSVDAGDGWLIFALPPTELAVHPTHANAAPELYFMCDDITRTVAELESSGAKVLGPVSEQPYGLVTSIRIPGGVELGLYEPRHKSPLSLPRRGRERPRRRKTPGPRLTRKR